MKKVLPKPEPALIHIKVESMVFSCHEIIEESKSVRRLIQIRNNYAGLISHYKGRGVDVVGDVLKVTTKRINPTLFSMPIAKKKVA